MFNLLDRLLALEARYGDTRLAPSEITTLIRKCIADANVKVETKRSNKVDLDQVVPAGEYDSEDDNEQEPCIHLALIYHPDQQHLCLTQVQWKRVVFEVVEVIGHEYVHRDQHRRKFNTTPYQSTLDPGHPDRGDQIYYGESCEIEAYAYSIAVEIVYYYDGAEECIPLSELYQRYLRLFSDDQSVILKLDKYISKYLNKVKAIKCQNYLPTTKKSKTKTMF